MDPINYLTFDENGYADKSKGSIFGDSDFGKYATKGFDLADETNQVIQIGGYDQYIYFKDIKGLKYGFTVDISNLIRLNNDPYPKVVSLLVKIQSELLISFLILSRIMIITTEYLFPGTDMMIIGNGVREARYRKVSVIMTKIQ
jgi:hypothetical protein